jgi:hypothetical protein
MRSFLVVSFIFYSFAVRAQFTDSTRHYIRLSAAGNLNRSNNATAYLLTNGMRYSIKNSRTSFNAGANWLYGEQDHNLTNNDFNATADFNLYHDSSNLYYWASPTTPPAIRLRSAASCKAVWVLLTIL